MDHRKPITFIFLSLFFAFYLAACSKTLAENEVQRSEEVTPTTSSIGTIAFTQTPSQPIVTITITTGLPTKTLPSTLTSTPNPSFTPTSTQPFRTSTFDPASIVTATKSPNAKCPMTDLTFKPIIPDQGYVEAGNYPDNQITLQTSILEALNKGATLQALQAAITKATGNGKLLEIKPNDIILKELTGDNVPEVIFDSDYRYAIFTCVNGEYILGLDIPSNALYRVGKTTYQDLNKDRISEIVIDVHDFVAVVVGGYLSIFQWDGSEFKNLNPSEVITSEFVFPVMGNAMQFFQASPYKIFDYDKNGTLDLVIRDDYIGTHAEAPFYGPWRIVTHVITWNGSKYIVLPPKFDPPTYRFQAVQDGDRALFRGDYEEALMFYDHALNDRKLKGWSEAHFENMQAAVQDEWDGKPTSTPLPDDQADYLALSGYARFRILFIHTVQGNFDLAQGEYQILQNDDSSDKSGFDYAELAKVFWEEYEKTGSLGSACGEARAYAAYNNYDEMTSQIDATWHGNQSPEYFDLSKTICPVE